MKRVVGLLLIFVMLFTSTSFASEMVEVDSQEIEQNIMQEMIVEPRYTYLAYMTVGLEIDENGRIAYVGSARSLNHNIRITLYLQRSTNGFIWEDLEATVKTAYDNVATSGWRNVTEGNYYYRVKIVTDVMDSNRNILETATGYSSQEQY